MNDDIFSDVSSNCSDLSYQSDIDQCQSVQVDLSNGSPIDVNNFNIVHYNINSITSSDKLECLSHFCNVMQIDVLIITESKLDNTIPSNILTINGYHEPLRRDRVTNGRHGGGVLIYIAESLPYQQQTNLQLDHYEHIWVDIKIKNQIFAINALYRPPNENKEEHDLFLKVSDDLLQKLHNHNANYKIITSDLNFGNIYCKMPLLQPKPLDNFAPDLFMSYGFNQIIDIPTRVSNESTSLIDLFFINSTAGITYQGTLPKIADHDGIFASFDIKNFKPKSKSKTVFDFKNCNVDGLVNFIKDFDFENIVFSLPVEQQANKFTEVLLDAQNKFIPSKTVTFKLKDQPWCNAYTRLLMRKKNRNYQIYKKLNSQYLQKINNNCTNVETVTRLKAKVDKASIHAKESAKFSLQANKRAKKNFFDSVNSTLKNHNLSAKTKFKILTRLMMTNKFSSIPPLIDNGITINEPQQKSNIFNNFFTSKTDITGIDDPIPALDELNIATKIGNFNTSPFELAKIIRDLKKSHFSHCGITGKFLSFISTPISFSLSQLFNNLFEAGFFPEIFKIAHVTPIFKKYGSKSDTSNYRPISLLPTLSKILESVIHNRLLSHCIENSLISDRQAAYLKGDSTTSQLLYIVHKIRLSWGIGNFTQGVFLDISSAFDKIWHKGLLAKISQFGIHDKAYSLLESYLSERKQIVVVDGIKSDELTLNSGVPQGSRLGPLLFIIFINDITKDIQSDILLFADDTSLLASGKNLEDTATILNRDLLKISEWAKNWKINFNAKKSKNMIFSKKEIVNPPQILLNDTPVERVFHHKHLGIYLTSNLDWSMQVSQVCLKANRKLSVLRTVKFLSRPILDLLYKTIVRSVIDYGLPVYYSSLNLCDKAKLERVQYNAAKIVTGALSYSSKEKLNYDLSWETIKDRAEFLGLTIFHKIRCQLTRPLIRSCMPAINLDQQYLLRNKSPFVDYPAFGAKFKQSFFPHFLKSYNNLPSNIKGLLFNDFKDHLATYLKPKRHKHFNRGSKAGNNLLTQIRVGRSNLHSHSFMIGLTDNPVCTCNDGNETSLHYFLKCNLFIAERQVMFKQFEQYIPTFKSMTLKKKHDIILYGYKIDDDDFLYINTRLTISVQDYILKTKRFNNIQ